MPLYCCMGNATSSNRGVMLNSVNSFTQCLHRVSLPTQHMPSREKQHVLLVRVWRLSPQFRSGRRRLSPTVPPGCVGSPACLALGNQRLWLRWLASSRTQNPFALNTCSAAVTLVPRNRTTSFLLLLPSSSTILLWPSRSSTMRFRKCLCLLIAACSSKLLNFL